MAMSISRRSMYVTALGFAVAQLSAFLALVLYLTVANRPAGSPFAGIFGIASVSVFLSAVFGVGFAVSIAPLDATTIFMATLCFPFVAVLELTLAYTYGDLLYFAGGAAKAEKPDFSKHSPGLGLWIVVPLWIVSSSGQLIILLTTDTNPLVFGLGFMIVTMCIIHFGYLRFNDADLDELTAGIHAFRFFKTGAADKPGYSRSNDQAIHKNTATWVFIMTGFECITMFIGFALSFLLPPVAISGIAMAIATRFVVSLPLLLWAHFWGYDESTRAFFRTERAREPGSALVSAGKVTATPTQTTQKELLALSSEDDDTL